MKHRLAVWVSVPVLVLMLGFIVVLASSDQSGSGPGPSPLIGKPAPAIAGPTLSGGSFDLADAEGQYVLVNFFATWCTPCIQEHPELVEFERRHRGDGDVSIVSVVYDADPDRVREFFADNGGDWPVVDDPDGTIALHYGVSGVPETYLVSPDGTVLERIVGGVTARALDGLIDRASVVPG